MNQLSNAVLSNQELRAKVEALEAENIKLKETVKEALTWVCFQDCHKPFEAPDMHGEMVSIRLTGLCLLAEIVQPGCRQIANARFGTDCKQSTEVGRLANYVIRR